MLLVNIDFIPDEMKALKNWLLWKYEDRKDSKGNIKKTKIPYQTNGKKAESTNPETWGSFENVIKTLNRFPDKFDGMGFAFSEDSGIMGLDFDHVRDPESGEWDAEAIEEIKSLNSYAEMSPSGTGAHVICIAKIPGPHRREGPREMYESGRYFTVTGDYIQGTAQTVNNAQGSVNALYYNWFNHRDKKTSTESKQQPEKKIKLSDSEIINIANRASNSDKFKSLYSGSITGYESHSEADLALCSMFAFYTQEEGQIDSLFRGSGLYRVDRWEVANYRGRTINKALQGVTETYNPEKGKKEEKENGIYSPEILKNVKVPENKREKLQIVKQFIEDNLMPLPKSEAEEIIITDIKEHFNLFRDEIANIKKFYKEAAGGRKDRYAGLSKNWTSDLEIDEEFEGLYTFQWNSDKTKVIDVLLHFDKIAIKALETLNTVSYKGQIYVYSGGYYDDTEEIVMKEITRIINGIRKGRFSSGIKSCSANVLHNILYFNPLTKYPFNNENTAIPVKNGIVLLDFENKTKKLIPHSPDYKFNYIIPTEYNENADPAPIDDILKQYSPDQVKELYQLPAQALMQMLGYGPFKKCYLLQGNRDAGKSSYIELLIRTFGTQNRCDVSLDMLNPKENKFALSSLEGKIFNIHDDMTYFSLKDTGTIKDLTGSYTKEIEKKGKQRYGADIRAVHCFACNKPPKYDGEIKKDVAFWERWVYIYFPNRFEKVLTFYDDNFTQENLSGFLNRVLDYVLEMGHDKKLVCNYSYADVRSTWAKCADPVFRFVTENMTKINENEKPMYYRKEDFLELIKTWARDQGEDEDEEVPATVIMLSKTIDICGIDSDARVTEEKTRTSIHVYGIPYKWKEESVYKDMKPQVIQLKTQAKFQ